MLARAAVALALLAAAAPLAAGDEAIPPVPCSDPRGCPDLVVDGLRIPAGTQRTETFSATHCAVVEGMVQPGARHLLRFTFNSPNLGPGDLVVGDPAEHPEWFESSPCHRHHHFREYADYRLWQPEAWLAWEALRSAQPDQTAAEVLAEHPELQPVVGRKQGFCVIDLWPSAPTPHGWVPPDERKYTSCRAQGISVGWADEYIFSLDGQWVDVTGVAPGPYMLEAEVNAERLYVEADYANNRAAFLTVVTPTV